MHLYGSPKRGRNLSKSLLHRAPKKKEAVLWINIKAAVLQLTECVWQAGLFMVFLLGLSGWNKWIHREQLVLLASKFSESQGLIFLLLAHSADHSRCPGVHHTDTLMHTHPVLGFLLFHIYRFLVLVPKYREEKWPVTGCMLLYPTHPVKVKRRTKKKRRPLGIFLQS